MNNVRNIAKSLLLTAFVFGVILVACKKIQPASSYIQDKEEELIIKKDSASGTVSSTVAKKIKFVLAGYSGTIPNFEDTAKKTLNILSEVFSSKEFKDSLLKYTFVCSNGSSDACLANRNKCDSELNLIKGETVYNDLIADTIKNIKIEIRPSSGSSSFGFTYVCSDKITSYDWFLKGGRTLPTPIEYAIHLAHEYTHTVGYVHSKKHEKSEDVAYRIGGIVRNILIRKLNLSAIAGQELASLLGKPKFNYMRIKEAELPELSPAFKQVYSQIANSFSDNDQTVSYLYLQFLPDNKVKLGLRATNNVSKTYFIITFDFDMTVDDDGICNFTYTGVNSANTANRERMKPIIDYLSSASFEVSFMNKRGPVNGIIGGFMSVEDPTDFFYGVMLDSL